GKVAGIFLLLAATVAVWVAADIYYYFVFYKYPGAITIKNPTSGVIEGFVYTLKFINQESMAWKHPSMPWWFGAGFLYRSLGGLVFGLFALGLVTLGYVFIAGKRGDNERRLSLMLLLGGAMILLSFFHYYAPARALAHYLPVALAIAVFGLNEVLTWANKRIGSVNGAWALLCGVLVLSAVWAPSARRIFDAMRAQGELQEFLREQGEKSLFLDIWMDTMPLAGNVKKIQGAKDEGAYVVTSGWSIKYPTKVYELRKDVASRLSGINLEKEFETYKSLPLYWYDYPHSIDVFDVRDPMGTNIRVFKLEEVKAALQTLDTMIAP
ncbi:MAG: hypothetical protein HQK87_07500, partial [Nitrospinae bacterium]|nr:hypothetical protein [Nitrospinota bacterium]